MSNSERELRAAHTIGVWELECGIRDGAPVIRMTMSVPGREGSLRRDWRMTRCGLDNRQLADIAATVTKSIQDGAIASVGIQQALGVL